MTKQLEVNPRTEILIKARDAIEKGWCQGAGLRRNPKTGTPEYCIAGSIWEAVGGFAAVDIIQTEVLRRIVETIYPIIGKAMRGYLRPSDITDWNDTEGRTKEEVLELMNQAIAVSISDGIHARSEAT